jgi:sortase (surface protein transpeptidase)
VALAVGAPATWWALSNSPPGPEGQGTAQELAGTTPSAPALTAPESPPPTASSLPVPSGSPAPAAVAAAPVLLQIPSLGIDSTVIAEGVEATGEMALPEDVSQVGWYQYSVAPGSAAGSTVLAGHVDSAVQGEGAMFRLRQAEVGAIVSVLSVDGSQHQYRVVAREQFGKGAVPLADLFARDGQPRLTLITCGGQFDAPTRSYESNIVVTAVPVAS